MVRMEPVQQQMERFEDRQAVHSSASALAGLLSEGPEDRRTLMVRSLPCTALARSEVVVLALRCRPGADFAEE